MNWHQQPTCELDSFDLPNLPEATMVWLTDERRGVRLAVLPAAGGEMGSLQVRIAGRWVDILHRGLEYSDWPCEAGDGRAPLLWPIVGRSFTGEQITEWERTGVQPVQNRYRVEGETFDIDIHGFVWRLPWQLKGYGLTNGAAYAACQLRSSADTLRMYPFDFELSATYRIEGEDIVLEYEVAAGDNARTMPFSIGNHLALRLPFTKQGRFGECTLRTPGHVILHQNPLCLLSGESTQVNFSIPTPLERGELLDTVLGGFRREGACLELNAPGSMSLCVKHCEKARNGKLLASDEDYFFVFWGDPVMGYFCPEPWIGKPNSLNTGEGCLYLPPGRRFDWEIRITPTIDV